VLRIKFSAGRQFSASKSASSPSAKTLARMAFIKDEATLVEMALAKDKLKWKVEY
jgi:hypothetical protein